MPRDLSFRQICVKLFTTICNAAQWRTVARYTHKHIQIYIYLYRSTYTRINTYIYTPCTCRRLINFLTRRSHANNKWLTDQLLLVVLQLLMLVVDVCVVVVGALVVHTICINTLSCDAAGSTAPLLINICTFICANCYRCCE